MCLVARSRNNFSQWVLCSKFQALYFDDGVYWRKHMWDSSSDNLETKNTFFFVFASWRSCGLHNVLVARSRDQLLAVRTLHQFSAIIFHDGVYWRKHRWGPSSGNPETKNTSFFRSCFLHFMCAAQNLSRYKLPLCILRDGFVCTYFLALYWLMVFIHETHVMPSSGKVKAKRHLFSYLVLAGSECRLMCQLLQTGTN